ncbi:MAG TPA: YtxH domain-containing protein [Cyclobacteriaceae bacterium]|nr:YtxH domain-containing protein [Cyclobacteriaceae bacterium]
MKTSKVIVGLAAAAVAGAAIGMLLAPEKGSDLQRKIKEEANKWLDEVRKLLNQGVTASRQLRQAAEDEIEEVKSNLKPIED